MEEKNDKLLKGLASGGEEGGGPLFAIFRPAPAPAPVPAPPPAPFKAPVPPEKPPPPPPPSQDREMIDYLKVKMTELESKLRESQEKGLAFAYELKGREEARKESRREMEEFLAEVKRQQVESETERSRGLELEKSRTRIEALELKIMELSVPRVEAPPPHAPAGEIEKLQAGLKAELSGDFELLGAKLADKFKKETLELLAARLARLDAESVRDLEELAKLRISLKEEIAEGFELLGGKLTEKILAEAMGPLAGRLDAESAAREKGLRDMRELAGSMADKVSSLENAFSKKIADMETLFAGFSLQMTAAVQAVGEKNEELRALAGTSFKGIEKVEAAMADEFGKMVSTGEEFRSGLRDVSAGMEASRKETLIIVEGLKRALEAGGAQAADSVAGRLVSNSAPYDLGFIIACFDNLEKVFCAAEETLARTSADARKSAGSPGADAAFIAHRQAAMLDSAVRDLGLALEVFRGVRQEALKPIKKILGA